MTPEAPTGTGPAKPGATGLGILQCNPPRCCNDTDTTHALREEEKCMSATQHVFVL